MSLVIAVEALFHCRRQLYSIHCMSSILIDKWDEETKFASNYNTFKLQYVLQFSNINSIIIVCMIKIIIVQLHLLEHTAPASREWEQALPKL